MNPVDLFTARGEFVRHCTDVAQERETVHALHPGAARIGVADDGTFLVLRVPGTTKAYTYELRKPAESMRKGA